MKYARIIVDNRSMQVDKPFTYSLGEYENNAEIGMRVIVPFGKGNRTIKGFIIDIFELEYMEETTKDIIDLLDDKPLISDKLLYIALWMKEEYLSSYLDCLHTVLPPGNYKEIITYIEFIQEYVNISQFTKEEKLIYQYVINNRYCTIDDLKSHFKISGFYNILKDFNIKGIIKTGINIKTSVKIKTEQWVKLNPKYDYNIALNRIGVRSKKQIQIYEFIFNNNDYRLNDLVKQLSTSLSTINLLIEKDIIIKYEKPIIRSPIKKEIPHYKKISLNSLQNDVYKNILENNEDKFLIHGVTGSGKTEVYLQLVEDMLNKGKDSIILVPEISLTPQTIDRFVGRFGNEVAVLHSKLSQGERFDQWRNIREGKVKIVVGARSAVFAPLGDLGLIVIDEEHEDTYKSSQSPKYDTIEVAKRRCELENAILVMGTATPSVRTYFKALNNEYRLLIMNKRVLNNTLPVTEIVDMRKELENGNKSIFSQLLYAELKDNLLRKKQSILFLNRRGFASFVSCRACGQVINCNNCDISMTYHKNINKLRCHYCGDTKDLPKVCPSCGSKYIKQFGIGTEKVEELTKELFPQANVVRMDSDTTSKKNSYDKILNDMKNGIIDILIGTQMITKGLDFPNVTLVGIVAADTTLNLPDYRAAEKSFQLITQVSGRAGRGDTSGKVILQTYNPDNYSIIHSKNQDFVSFFNTEIKLRREFLYPPFINIISILVYGENNSLVNKTTNQIYDIIYNRIAEIHNENIRDYLIGPNVAPIEKINKNYRWQIIIKETDNNLDQIKKIINETIYFNRYNLDFKGIKFNIDINPNNIL